MSNKLLSHERLRSLEEQLEYLSELFRYTKQEFAKSGGLDPSSEYGNAIGNDGARAIFNRLDLETAQDRIKLEIAFLKDYLEIVDVDAEWINKANQAREESYASEDEVAQFKMGLNC